MSISGTYYVKMWLPNPALVHGPGDPPGGPAGPDALAGPGTVPAEEAPVVELKDHGTPGENFFEGDITFHLNPNPDGTLSGDAGGAPINSGYYTGDDFFKVDFNAGPGRWDISARVQSNGDIEGVISVGGGKGFPNLVYGKKLL